MAKNIKVTLTLDNSKYNRSIKQSATETKRFTKDTKSGVNGLKTAFAGLVGAFGIQQVTQLGDEFTNLNNRLKAVTSSGAEAENAFRLVNQVASQSRSDLSATASLFADLSIATKDLGTSQAEIADVTRVFSQTLAISGADAGAASGAIRQFGQALASGVLRGDEFNSIAETNSAFMLQFAEALGKPLGQLRALAADGKLTAEVVLEATKKMAAGVQADFDKTTATIGQSFTKLRNSFLKLFGDVESETGVFEGLAGAVDRLANAINEIDIGNFIKNLDKLIYAVVLLTTVFGFRGLLKVITKMQGSFIAIGKIFTRTSTGIFSLQYAAKALTTTFRGLFGIVTLGFGFAGKGGLFGAIGTTIAGLSRILLRFVLGPVGAVLLGLEAINFVVKLMTGKDYMGGLRDTVIGLTKDMLGLEKQAKETATAIDPNNLIPGSQAHSDYYNLFGTQDPMPTGGGGGTGGGILDETLGFMDQFEKDLKGMDQTTIKYLATIKNFRKEFTEQLPDGIINTNEEFADLKSGLDAIDSAFGDVADSYKQSITDSEKAAEKLAEENAERLAAVQHVQDTVAALTGQIITTEELNNANSVLQAFLEKYPELANQVIDAKKRIDDAYSKNEGINNFVKALEGASKTLSEDLADDLLKGQSVMDSFKDFFKKLIKQMIADLIRLYIIQTALAPLLGKFGLEFGAGGSIQKRAMGGPVMANTPYIVGEKGPEVFVSNGACSITPNHQMGGSTQVTYNITATDAPSFQQLVAQDPQFIYAVTQAGARSIPGSR